MGLESILGQYPTREKKKKKYCNSYFPQNQCDPTLEDTNVYKTHYRVVNIMMLQELENIYKNNKQEMNDVISMSIRTAWKTPADRIKQKQQTRKQKNKQEGMYKQTRKPRLAYAPIVYKISFTE